MANQKQFRLNSLAWVKHEIDESLAQAREAVLAYANDPDTVTHLGTALPLIKDVLGTLEVAELQGAAMLARECLEVVRALAAGECRQREEAARLVVRALIQLPDYLEYIQSGQEDIPIVLVSILNDLRNVRNEELLSDGVVEIPSLEQGEEDARILDGQRHSGEDLGKIAHLTRHAFELGLLGLYRNQNVDESLRKMALVCKRLRFASGTRAGRRLWWVTEALLTALHTRSLDSSAAVKALLGKVARQIKLLFELGEQEFSAQIPAALVRSILYYVGNAQPDHPLVAAVQEAYFLHEDLPSPAERAAVRSSMAGHNRALYRSVAKALSEDLADIKDQIEAYPAAEDEVAALRALVASLARLADTLGMLELEALQDRARQEHDELQRLLQNGRVPDAEVLARLAEMLVGVEGAIAAFEIDGQGVLRGEDTTEPADLRAVRATVVRETLSDIEQIKQQVQAHAERGDAEALAAVPGHLTRMHGALVLLEIDDAVTLVDGLRAYLQRAVAAQARLPQDALERLAEAVAALEVFLEVLDSTGQAHEEYLQAGLEALQALERIEPAPVEAVQPAAFEAPTAETQLVVDDGLPAGLAGPDESVAEGVEQTLLDLEALTESLRFDDDEEGAADEQPWALEDDLTGTVLMDAIEAADDEVARIGEGLEPTQQVEAETELAVFEEGPDASGAALTLVDVLPEPEPAAAVDPFAELPVMREAADPEMLEIFVEELEDELARLREAVPAWRERPDDAELQTVIRRAFHTLKGSGRLIGAEVLGEFAWAHEKLLNAVLDGQLAPRPELIACIAEAVALLPGLRDDLAEARRPGQPVLAQMAWAARLAEGRFDEHWRESPAGTPDETAAAPATEAAEAAPAAESEDLSVDLDALLATEGGQAEMPDVPATEAAEAAPVAESEELSVDLDALLATEGGQAAAATPPPADVAEADLAEDFTAALRELPEAELPPATDAPDDNDTAAPLLAVGPEDLDALAGDFERALGDGEPAELEEALEQEPADLTAEPFAFGGFGDEADADLEALLSETGSGMAPEGLDESAEFDALEMLIADDTTGDAAAPLADLPAETAAGAPDEERRELLAIFGNEARQHLASIAAERERLAALAAGEPPGEALRRAVHTLNGSARTAEVPAIHTVASLFERYLRDKHERQAPLDAQDLALLADLEAHVAAVLEALEAGGALPEADALKARMAALLEAAEQAPATEAPPAEQAPVVETPATEAPGAAPGDDASEVDAGAQAEPVAGEEETVAPEAGGESASGPVSDEGVPAAEPSPTVEVAEPADALVEVFLEESQDILDVCEEAMARWQNQPEERAPVGDLRRELHTLKGGARMAGLTELGNLAHALETLFIDVAEERLAPGRGLFKVIHAAFDRINEMTEAARQGHPLPAVDDVLDLLVRARQDSDSAEAAASSVLEQAIAAARERPAPGAETPVGEAAAAAEAPPAGHLQEAVKVPAELLDQLLDNVGEANVYRARIEQQMTSFGFNLQELDQTIRRLTEQLRRLEMEAEAQILHRLEEQDIDPDESGIYEKFDPLELDRYSNVQQLSRALAESTNDLVSIHGLLSAELATVEQLVAQQERIGRSLQDGLMQTRMSSFRVMVPRLRRVVRRTALELDKEAELRVQGAEEEMDRKILEGVVVPLEHMLRNAVAHGIEPPEVRRAAGKPPVGTVDIHIRREGAEVVIEVADDGAGIDHDRVLARARELGLVEPGQELAERDIHALILEPGFSTAETVSQVAGRGVGMDVVQNQLNQLNGVLEVASTPGKGTRFTISLPYTLAISQSLLVRMGGATYAIPMASVDGIIQLKGKALNEKLAQQPPVIRYGSRDYRLRQLARVLEPEAAVTRYDEAQTYHLILSHAGEHDAAFVIDALEGNQEVVVKSAGPLLSQAPGISGATILGDGRVVLILDIPGLIRSLAGQAELPAAPPPEVAPAEQRKPLIMVVDDSITIRKVTAKMLTRSHYEVVTAKDGRDALSQLQNARPDMLLLDIEMPRMDGFELAQHLKGSVEYRDIPIIMISSRTGRKHREKAQELGVERFLGKPYQDAELLETIESLLDRTQVAHGSTLH